MARPALAASEPAEPRRTFVAALSLALLFASAPGSVSRPVEARVPQRGPALSAALDTLLSDPVLARALVGIRLDVLADPARATPASVLYTRDSGKLLMPASNLKLVTLAVAADRLGWDFAYDTALELHGSVAAGTLTGDLVVVGGGDPSITGQDYGPAPLFFEWAEALKAAGVRRVDGRLIGNDRLFDHQGIGRGWSWDYLDAAYAAPSGALSYNENAIVVRISPGASAGAAASVDAAPPGHGLTIRNLVTTGPADGERRLDLTRAPGQSVLTVSGTIPLGSGPVVRGAAVPDPTRFFLDGLRLALADRGILVRDGVCSLDDASPGPAGIGRVVARRTSAPLSALAGYFLKVSQNFYADMLLKTIARSTGQPGTVADGVRAVRETIGPWGIAPDEVVMNDGSGLSRYDYLTADAVVTILRHVWQDPRLRGPFVAALPVAGRDGTLETRMRGTILDDRVEGKTGTLANVRSLSGYLETTSGTHVAFAILVNNFTAPAAQIDAVVEKVLEQVARQ